MDASTFTGTDAIWRTGMSAVARIMPEEKSKAAPTARLKRCRYPLSFLIPGSQIQTEPDSCRLSPSILIVSADIQFPPDAGVIDVSRPPWNARGDGIHDDTEPIQRALHAYPDGRAIIYLPAGAYLVSGTLTWPPGSINNNHKNTILQGRSTSGTIIKLKDSCAGFGDPAQPRPVIRTGEAPAQRFRNAIRNLTVDTGSINPGAIGVQFIANNQGGLRDVVIRSGDGEGVIGLDMSYSNEIGPLYVKRLLVRGFDTGIATGHVVDSMTFEYITLEDQHQFGFVNDGQCVSIRGLYSRNSVPALINKPGPGMVTLIDSGCECGEAGAVAIDNHASLFARNVMTSGYAAAIANSAGHARGHADEYIDEFVSHDVLRLFENDGRSLGMPVKNTPEVDWEYNFAHWSSPTHFADVRDSGIDASLAIQKAVDSGATTVYLPRGIYHMQNPVIIRNNVRRIIGCEAFLDVAAMDRPAFTVADGTAETVVFERIESNFEPNAFFDNRSSRSLVLSSCCNISGHFTGKGDLFIEDVCSNPNSYWKFAGQHVWARQFNPENDGVHVLNDGGALWILGFKTERNGPLIVTEHGGKTEVLGAFVYATSHQPCLPAFVVKDSQASITAGESFYGGRCPFIDVVKEIRNGQTQELRTTRTPGRENGFMLPLFVGK
ncbi:MAG: endopolygalacturonase [Chitinivibrionales bacterium]|nr:endopolygalacturonase [Chitinivibrionales bacterium]